MSKKLRIGYLSASDPQNLLTWSGTHHSIFHCLTRIGRVIPLGPVNPLALRGLLGGIHKAMECSTGKRWNYRHSKILSIYYARCFEKKIRLLCPDILVAPAASAEIAYLNTSLPILYITDGTFRLCKDYHTSLQNLAAFSIRESDEAERKALQKADTIIVSSDWCAHSVMDDYGIPQEKVVVQPFGANLEDDFSLEIITNRVPQRWNLFFLASHWKNKGGDIVLRTVELLRKNHPNVVLHIAGARPDVEKLPDGTVYHGFLRKNIPQERKKLLELFRMTHLMLLPTRFDCTPVSICEASMFGVPSLLSQTGGVEGHLKNGENGFLLPYEDKGEVWAQTIQKIISDPSMYFELRKKSRRVYEEKLNWKCFTEVLYDCIKKFFPAAV